jgi:hypothetical protein
VAVVIERLYDMTGNFIKGMWIRLRQIVIGPAGHDDREIKLKHDSVPLWENPCINRMDIRRTLAGSSGTNDGLDPSHPQ